MSRPIGPLPRSTLRVRYAETDAMGVVYHTNHIIQCTSVSDRNGSPRRFLPNGARR